MTTIDATSQPQAINAAGLALIKGFEGCKLTAYQCPAGIWTCGYGATGPDVGPDTVWTQEQADARLQSDLRKFEQGVGAALIQPATANQFSAMVCLAYNIGLGNFETSTVRRDHNAGNAAGAADAFLMWDEIHGQVCNGLLRRREAERALYLTA